MISYIRQLEVFNPDEFNTPVHIIGAGATGSWLTLMLAKLGVKDITVWDFDKVESHNIPNQAYKEGQIGENKVDALYNTVYEATGIKIKTKNKRVTGNEQLEGIVFLLTDTMKSRKEIFEKSIRYKYPTKLLIETRMGLEGGRIYTINPMSPTHVKEYEKTLYSDEEAEVSACGASQSIVATATQIASYAVWQFLNWVNDEEIQNEILIDCRTPMILNKKFDD